MTLREQLIYSVQNIGIKAKVISQKTGILACDLSRFKNGKIELCLLDCEKLKNYLDTFNSFFSKAI